MRYRIILQNVCKILFFAAIVFCTVGCAGPYLAYTLSPATLHKQRQISALNSSEPSWNTKQFLRTQFLASQYEKKPTQVIEELYSRTVQAPNNAAIFATAELSLLQARRMYKKNPQKAITMYLKAAALAYDYLFLTEEFDSYKTLRPNYRFMELIYNRAVARFVDIHQRTNQRWDDVLDFEYLGTHYEISVENDGRTLWNANDFDELIPSNQVKIKGVRNIYFEGGLGAALVGFVQHPKEHPIFAEYSPHDGLAQPITAILEFQPGQKTNGSWHRKATISFYNPLLTNSAVLAGRKVPLEADYTTPLGVFLAKIKAKEIDLASLLSVRQEIGKAGIYMLEPYREDQIPVVMVHGLMSRPATWMQMFNDLRGDPVIRSKYQFWFFLYPTGLPIMYSASLLRDELRCIRNRFDPDGTNPNFNKMVLIGHSMGGLLTRMMVHDSGDKYWNDTFVVSPDRLSVSRENKQFIKNMLIFEKLPFVRRVIFLAVPHRGCKEADSLLSKIGSLIISFPDEIEDLRKELRAEDMTEDAVEIMERLPAGVMQLSASSPVLEMMADIELDKSVAYHSVIAIDKYKYPFGTTDGLVTYESAHLNITDSEKLVPGGHGLHRHPLTIAEVKRILLLHLGDNGDGGS